MKSSGRPVISKIKKARAKADNSSDLCDKLLEGDRLALARAITLVESDLAEHQVIAQELVSLVLPHSGNSVRIGISGTPGAGKSTFIEAFGTHLTENGKKVAVLAVDPSSTFAQGSILGDKTRMAALSANPNAFIRPSPSAGHLGGVARKTREVMLLCEAAGFDTILVETVGVGQSETEVRNMTDFFLLITITGAGDELQGVKRGIMEAADLVLINKADGDNLEKAKAARTELSRALHFFPPFDSGWIPKVAICSALTGAGIPEVLTILDDFVTKVKANGFFGENRKLQQLHWMHSWLKEELVKSFYQRPDVTALLHKTESEVSSGKLSVTQAVKQLLALNS